MSALASDTSLPLEQPKWVKEHPNWKKKIKIDSAEPAVLTPPGNIWPAHVVDDFQSANMSSRIFDWTRAFIINLLNWHLLSIYCVDLINRTISKTKRQQQTNDDPFLKLFKLVLGNKLPYCTEHKWIINQR